MNKQTAELLNEMLTSLIEQYDVIKRISTQITEEVGNLNSQIDKMKEVLKFGNKSGIWKSP